MTDPTIDLTKPTREQVKATEERGRQLMEAWRKRRLAADDWRHYDSKQDEQ